MTTLWASLIGLILIALAVVLVFNHLQGRRERSRGARRGRWKTSWRGSAGDGVAVDAAPEKGAARARAALPGSRTDRTENAGPLAGAGTDLTADAATGDEDFADTLPREPPRSAPGGSPVASRDTARGAALRVEPTLAAQAPPDRAGPSDSLPVDGEPRAGRGTGHEGTQRGGLEQGSSGRGGSEHVLGGDGGPAGFRAAGSEPAVAPAARTADGARAATRTSLDPRLDCIVEVDVTGLLGAERLIAMIGPLRRAGSKPLVFEADAGDGGWQAPQAGRTYRRVRVGVLLANRHGPLNAMEFTDFAAAIGALGRQLGGHPVVPDMAQVLERARELDEACAQLDAQIGINVETPRAMSPGELSALAAGLDLVERGNNRFARLGDAAEVLFSLALGDRANQLTLLLDVPRAPPEFSPWEQMLDCAQACAERTGGTLVDDAARPLTEHAVGAVSRQLAQRYASLEEAGLAAGSVAALRVFN